MSLVRTALVVLGLVSLSACASTGTVTASSRDGFGAAPASPNWGTTASPPEPKAPAPREHVAIDRNTSHAADRMPRVR